VRKQSLKECIQLDVILVDAGSEDGTQEQISLQYPEVDLVAVNSEVFWNQGMRLAFNVARKRNYEFYLWINDDTVLYEDAVDRLITFYFHRDVTTTPLICVGTTGDPVTGEVTYGGYTRSSKMHPLKFSLLKDSGSVQAADTMNGNCVLISQRVGDLVGNLSPEFRHSIGDFDYGLRARRLGIDIMVIPGFVGECTRNDVAKTWLDRSRSLSSRWQQMKGPKGLPPKEWYTFCRRHAGLLWPLFFSMPFARLLLSAASPRMPRKGKMDKED
jgi:GT2 family glycosyltransferase